ncbi:hypothetical protein BDR06DRAFT_972489 [Suillus hirtellus]|nr:hypothetical protein BDR06DRAFT_972489 [Suillus hirtellus]
MRLWLSARRVTRQFKELGYSIVRPESEEHGFIETTAEHTPVSTSRYEGTLALAKLFKKFKTYVLEQYEVIGLNFKFAPLAGVTDFKGVVTKAGSGLGVRTHQYHDRNVAMIYNSNDYWNAASPQVASGEAGQVLDILDDLGLHRYFNMTEKNDHELVREDAHDVMHQNEDKCIENDIEHELSIIIELIAGKVGCYQEIDTHRHAAIIVATYTEYAASFDASQWTNCTNEPPAGQRRFAFSEVMNFAASLLTDVAKILPSYYFSTRAMKLANFYANDYLVQQPLAVHWLPMERSLSYGKIWISFADAAVVARRGFRIIQAPSNHFYLDYEMAGATPSKLVRGEQILWSEQSDPQNVDPIMWPRAASSAEIFWSGKQSIGAALNVTEALPRLHLSFTQNLTYLEKCIPLLCEKSRGEMEVDEVFE